MTSVIIAPQKPGTSNTSVLRTSSAPASTGKHTTSYFRKISLYSQLSVCTKYRYFILIPVTFTVTAPKTLGRSHKSATASTSRCLHCKKRLRSSQELKQHFSVCTVLNGYKNKQTCKFDNLKFPIIRIAISFILFTFTAPKQQGPSNTSSSKTSSKSTDEQSKKK